jgi:hypothetical protein
MPRRHDPKPAETFANDPAANSMFFECLAPQMGFLRIRSSRQGYDITTL